MATILITGANKGLGFEAARQLVAAGHIVYVAARDPQRGKDAAQRLGGRFVQVDVTDDASVTAAAAAIGAEAGLGRRRVLCPGRDEVRRVGKPRRSVTTPCRPAHR